MQIDTTDPPGNETKVVDYVRRFSKPRHSGDRGAKDPARANLIARLKGNGTKRPILIMGHTDTVHVDPPSGPFRRSARRATAAMSTGAARSTTRRSDRRHDDHAAAEALNVPLDRDVIFVSEAGEEARTGLGIEYLVKRALERYRSRSLPRGRRRRDSARRAGAVTRWSQTAEKIRTARDWWRTAPAGPRIASAAQRTPSCTCREAVEKIALWDPPMRFNDTTARTSRSWPRQRAGGSGALPRHCSIRRRSAAAREYLAEHEPAHYSMLHTSISPNIFRAAIRSNVIPSEAEATLDVRALPDEDIASVLRVMRKVINDPAVEIVPRTHESGPGAAPSRIDSEAYQADRGRDIANLQRHRPCR